MTRLPPDIVTFARERAGAWLGDLGDWSAWLTFLRALFALPLDDDDRRLFALCCGDREPPAVPCREAVVIAGRRSRKSAVGALVAVYAAICRDHRQHLAAGAVARVLICACDKDQAGEVLGYVRGVLESHPALARRVVRVTATAVELGNRTRIEVVAKAFRNIRGRTVVAAVFDELAFWRSDESANPDREVLRAVQPAMATVPGSLLLMLSSPYARRGLLWERFRDDYGKPSPCLVWRAPTLTMNPLVDPAVVERAYRDDPVAAAAEWGGEFRTDVETFVDAELVAGLAREAPLELRPVAGISYVAFADPSGGRGDAFALAVAHREGEHVVVDVVRQRRPPFDPGAVVTEFAALMRAYGVRVVVGDRYAGEWVATAFRAHGVEYRPAAMTRSELYVEMLPLLTRGLAELPPDRVLLAQLSALERRTGRGKDVIDHPPGAHDDLANAAAGALVEAIATASTADFSGLAALGASWAASPWAGARLSSVPFGRALP